MKNNWQEANATKNSLVVVASSLFPTKKGRKWKVLEGAFENKAVVDSNEKGNEAKVAKMVMCHDLHQEACPYHLGEQGGRWR